MKNSSAKKFLSVALIGLFAIGVLAASGGVALAQTISPQTLQSAATTQPATTSQTPSIWACTANIATCGVFYVALVLTQIVGIFVAAGALLVQLGLAFRLSVFSSPAIQNGFGVCLSIANLAFVLGIIVIAIATILRSETYGYKKGLWRLIAMAILVNFGLVITAPIVGFANGMTNYFLSSINGGGSASVTTFINNLMQVTSPGAANQPSNCAASATVQNNFVGPLSPQTLNSLCPPGQNQGTISVSATFSQALLTLFFSFGFQAIIAFALFAIGALVFISYLWLSVLLVLLPLAWVTWIFPNFSHEFSQWWKHFIKWTFFAPAALFFIWLAMSVANSGRYMQSAYNSSIAGVPTNTPLAAIAAAIGSSAAFNQLISNLIVLGIMLGGLMAASSMTGKAGEFAVKQGQALGGYVGRRSWQLGKRATTAPFRSKAAKNLASRFQQPPKTALGKFANDSTLGIGGWARRKLGQGMETVAIAGGSGTVDAAADRFKGLTPDQKINRLSGVEKENAAPQRMALLKQILDEKNIGKLSTEEMERYFGKGQENSFKRFGQEKLYKDLREKSGLALQELSKEIKVLEAQPKPLTKEDSDKLTDKQNEKKKLVAAYIKENPDGAVDAFTDPDKLKKRREEAAKSGRIPASLTPESMELMQQNIAEGIAGGLSTQIVSNLLKSMAEKNNLDGFTDAIEKMKKSTDPAIVALVAKMQADYANNGALQKWNVHSVDRGVLDVDLGKIYS